MKTYRATARSQRDDEHLFYSVLDDNDVPPPHERLVKGQKLRIRIAGRIYTGRIVKVHKGRVTNVMLDRIEVKDR